MNEILGDGYIELVGLRFTATHGALPGEAQVPQPFTVDLFLRVDIRHAGVADDLSATVDYVQAAAICSEVMGGPRRQLIETLALEIAERLLRRFPSLLGGEVVVHKPAAPIGPPAQDVRARVAFARTPS